MLTRLELDELFHPLPRLETTRLVLEPLRIGHADALFEVFSDAAVTSASSDTPHASAEVTRTHIGGILRLRIPLHPIRRSGGIRSGFRGFDQDSERSDEYEAGQAAGWGSGWGFRPFWRRMEVPRSVSI